MLIDDKWASPQDFATLFQYFWYRDFPIDQKAIGAHRADWTIHIGIVVRNIADLMGLFTRFESGGRTDAILRSKTGNEIAIEWEWKDTWPAELRKLHSREIKPDEQPLKYSVLITYTDAQEIESFCNKVTENWQKSRWQLLVILITVRRVSKKEITTRREFKDLKMLLFNKNGHKEWERTMPALPWNVRDTRWSIEHIGKWNQKNNTQ